MNCYQQTGRRQHLAIVLLFTSLLVSLFHAPVFASDPPGNWLPDAEVPPGMRGMHGVVIVHSPDGRERRLIDRTIITFVDGSYTFDLFTVFNDGVFVSRALHPERWGRIRKNSGKLELMLNTNSQFTPIKGQWTVRPANQDQRLTGCFSRLAGGARFSERKSGDVIDSHTQWCFGEDGRFTHSAEGYYNTSRQHPGKANVAMQGRYRIDGYAIRFLYDNGEEMTSSFSFLSGERGDIALNGQEYGMRGEPETMKSYGFTMSISARLADRS